jgi:hypothetical protein
MTAYDVSKVIFFAAENVRMKKIYLAFTLLILLACNRKEKKVNPCVYFWKQEFRLNSTESSFIKDNGIHTIYLRLMDIDWDQNAVPEAVLHLSDSIPEGMEVIPVIFIRNKVFEKLSKDSLALLADRIFRKASLVRRASYKEWQFDCDWTESTSKKYFDFLERFAKLTGNGSKLSATIRLHQVKYAEKTGVPPVQRGMLMYYNIGDLSNNMSRNSIYNKDDAKKYYEFIRSYPLPLDAALPLFSWAVVKRKGKVHALINNFPMSILQDTALFFSEGKEYRVKSGIFVHGEYLDAGDMLRIEKVSMEELEDMRHDILNRIKNTEVNLSFFSLDSNAIKSYDQKDLRNFITDLR